MIEIYFLDREMDREMDREKLLFSCHMIAKDRETGRNATNSFPT